MKFRNPFKKKAPVLTPKQKAIAMVVGAVATAKATVTAHPVIAGAVVITTLAGGIYWWKRPRTVVATQPNENVGVDAAIDKMKTMHPMATDEEVAKMVISQMNNDAGLTVNSAPAN